MSYNLTQLAESDTIFKLVVYTNDSTGGLMVGLFLLSIFFIMLMAFKRYEFIKALMASSLISFVISLFFVFAKLINPYWALALLIIAGAATFIDAMS
jgi:hypothetical protein